MEAGCCDLFLNNDQQFSLPSHTLDLLYKLFDVELLNLGIT